MSHDDSLDYLKLRTKMTTYCSNFIWKVKKSSNVRQQFRAYYYTAEKGKCDLKRACFTTIRVNAALSSPRGQNLQKLKKKVEWKKEELSSSKM